MELLKNRKISLLITLTIILTLAMATVSFAGVDAGPNGEYCTIMTVSGHGEAWRSTVNDPMYGARSIIGIDEAGGVGGLPVTIEYCSGCQYYYFASYEVDAQGDKIGTFNISPLKFTPSTSSAGTISTQLPTSWFEKGKLYKVFSLGVFEGLTEGTSSTVCVRMID